MKRNLKWALIFSFFINLFVLAVPLYSLQVFDRVLSSRSLETLSLLTLIILWFIFLYAVLDWIRSRMIFSATNQWEDTISKLIYFSDLVEGEQTENNKLKDHLNNVKSTLHSSFSTILDIPWSPIFVIILTFLHPLYGSIALTTIALLVTMAYINYQINTRRKPSEKTEEIIFTADVKAMGLASPLTESWCHGKTKNDTDQTERQIKNTNVKSLSKGLRLLTQVAIIATGAYLVLDKQLTAGAMIAASMMAGRAFSPYEATVTGLHTWLIAWKSWQRLQNMNQYSESLFSPKTELPTPKGNLEIRGLMSLHPNTQTPFLHSINLDIPAGSCLGIVGISGSGKTTLLKLCIGLRQPTLGSVRLDSATFSQWPNHIIGQYLGYLDQESAFYNHSIKDNISRFSGDDDKYMIDACIQVGMHQTILMWPLGYDTKIGPEFKPSNGEMQRLLLARAIYKDPVLLVLDEPDSYQDPTGENVLEKLIIRRKKNNLTTIFSTNRSPLLNIATRIIVMKSGRIKRDQTPGSITQESNLSHSKKKIKNEHNH